MLDHDGDTHLYLQIAAILRKRIRELRPGASVPSETAIQREFGVARTTARRAIKALRREGLVYTVQGQGTFVGRPGEAPREARKTPLYREIADDIISRIRRGEISPRRPVPSEAMMTQTYGVARMTARQAIATLRAEGWVYTVPHRGSYVCAPENWPAED
ncbi:hypothetical protein GCM10010116_48960 [Microbispora rosea subsp. aerata]|nr:GntR family transcriptional regulator [Microbispora rosea]GGO24358.1 hypothetical protein GCM10010116_48960 [Microbispora rosea subsp. aerata]GIH57940.1 hypothetical protein Mro02_48540 [Microbispora rosea subsp. aerata]GLJ86838.1 hypothetical protein GCM10017588_55790 [Microbispora rosea subsp. aerata]